MAEFCEPYSSSDNTLHADEEALFEAAAEYIQNKAAEIDRKTLLYLYSYFKQAKDGPCRTSKPGLLDFKGREKWTAWKSLGEEVTVRSAMKAYVKKVEELYPQWSEEANSTVKGKSIGPVMSTLADNTEPLPDSKKTLFDYVKEGNCFKMQEYLSKSNVNTSDEENMTLLHWACDRGHLEVVKILLEHGADMNARDSEGQTPLHYSSSCGHAEVVSELVKNGADRNIVDHDNQCPRDVALNETVVSCFS